MKNIPVQIQNEIELKYLVIEDSLKVCEGIAVRMDRFKNWSACRFAHHVDDAKKITDAEKPQLVFIDWALKGGSAFEVLSHVQNIPNYNPYIIFNTGYQSENPEIPQEIINNYSVDKYIIKPIWESLRKNLETYIQEAEEKITHPREKKDAWLTDINKRHIQADLSKLVCICQDFSNPYFKNFHFKDGSKLTVKLSWTLIIDLLNQKSIDYFITNSRQHIVVKKCIESYSRPFIKLKYFKNKVEVVKDKLHEFELWLHK